MRKLVWAAATVAVLSGAPVAARAGSDEVALLFLADPQVHNAYGTSLKQMFPLADWVSKVAIRPPEVNLLAPLTLRHAIVTGQARLDPVNRTVIVLGDGTNIGCSGEADVFDAEFTRATARPGTVRLMAHGNHDSYLMGTVNAYGPAGANAWTPGQTMTASLPVDEAWWNPTDAPVNTGTSLQGRNWLDACYKPAGADTAAGTPMNKLRWLARYARSLQPHGLVQTGDGAAPHDGLKFSGAASPGSALAALNYRSRGIWYRPRPQAGRGGDYARAWDSFMVQAVDIDDRHALVLIDTSVCRNARGGLRFAWTNAGTHSCIGRAQFDSIQALVDQIPKSRNVIFAGHFPLKDLKSRERRRLIAMMQDANPSGWTYVSGHTHEELSLTPYPGGVDWNIGSTTDWPMESHVLRFDAASSHVLRHESTVLTAQVQPLDYASQSDMAGRYSELCRHLGAAEALATAQPADYRASWVSPSMTPARCEEIQAHWAQHANALVGHQATISDRFDRDAAYRDFILRVAAGASRYEAGQRRFGPRRIP